MIKAAASAWIDEFGSALARSDCAAAVSLFVPDGHWRDLLSFTWRFKTVTRTEQIRATLEETVPSIKPRVFRLAENRMPPRRVTRAGQDSIEAMFTFETALGRGHGVVRLVEDSNASGGFRAWTLLTGLRELRGFEESVGERRPEGEGSSWNFGAENWLDRRIKASQYDGRDPAVLVIGAGQAGLGVAARLGCLGIDALIVDRIARVGDNWRNRYHALSLHNEVWGNDLPYMPFPQTWPTYIPKDKLAGWFEAYAETMELNVWTGTELIHAEFDDRAKHWTAELTLGDGTKRTLRPRHIIMATGVSGIPVMPTIPGLNEFSGAVMHSSAFQNGKQWSGRKAIVIGTGNSGHDVAQELYSHGADTILVQRGSSQVVSINPSARLAYAMYNQGMPVEDCDLLLTSLPYPVARRAAQLSTSEMRRLDKDLLDGLAAAGFKTDFGDEGTGYLMSFMTRGGGYYLNVGCSNLIAEKKIRLVQYSDIDRFESSGVKLRDGDKLALDLVVLATGYKPQQELVRKLFGDEVAERVGPIWGIGEDGELRNMWKRTRQQGLWFSGGSLAQSRIYSRYLALQIKAQEEALIG